MYLYDGNRVVASGVSRVYVHHLCAHTCRRARVAERPHFAVDALTFSSVTWSGETGRAGALTGAWRRLCIGGSLPATKTLPQQHAEVWGTTDVAAACGGALCLPIELCRRGGVNWAACPCMGFLLYGSGEGGVRLWVAGMEGGGRVPIVHSHVL